MSCGSVSYLYYMLSQLSQRLLYYYSIFWKVTSPTPLKWKSRVKLTLQPSTPRAPLVVLLHDHGRLGVSMSIPLFQILLEDHMRAYNHIYI